MDDGRVGRVLGGECAGAVRCGELERTVRPVFVVVLAVDP
jgi:hypothetical protein